VRKISSASAFLVPGVFSLLHNLIEPCVSYSNLPGKFPLTKPQGFDKFFPKHFSGMNGFEFLAFMVD
jgi:hypothetical protein